MLMETPAGGGEVSPGVRERVPVIVRGIWPGLRGGAGCGAGCGPGGVQPPLSCVIISTPDDSRRTENGIFWERFQLLMVPRCPANVNVPRGTQIIIMLNSDTYMAYMGSQIQFSIMT
ncbi:uncharacterized protein Dsimw501_GD28473 [Drosophila simulans]|uniref:Uncharacterized protein n=1 Tax=Drosophila simulans TaxID=7240 RepID=A0A0J9QZ69_DROSI|nr:uncharacterized protein Dsimw501_GD28473 [Drosophila simulans]